MKTFLHLWHCIAKFFLQWEIFQLKLYRKTLILCSVTFFQKPCRLWDHIEKCSGAREAAGNMAHGMLGQEGYTSESTRPRSCTHTHTHTNMQYLLLFHDHSGSANAPHYYVVRTLSVVYLDYSLAEYDVVKSDRYEFRKNMFSSPYSSSESLSFLILCGIFVTHITNKCTLLYITIYSYYSYILRRPTPHHQGSSHKD
jgi:hypothetical protein